MRDLLEPSRTFKSVRAGRHRGSFIQKSSGTTEVTGAAKKYDPVAFVTGRSQNYYA
jgi:hypothetical protein